MLSWFEPQKYRRKLTLWWTTTRSAGTPEIRDQIRDQRARDPFDSLDRRRRGERRKTSYLITKSVPNKILCTMDGFIKQVSSQVGVDESQASSFIGKILDFVKKNADSDVSKEISSKVPGADELISKATASDGSTNDLLKPCMPVLEMFKKLIGQVFGQDASKAAEVTEIMSKSGVSPTQGADMIQKLLEFLKGKVGPDTVSKLTEQVPALQAV